MRPALYRLLLLVAAGSLAPSAPAQTVTGTILGVVRDSSGAAVPGANVTARNARTGFERSTLSDPTGAYLIPNLPVGQYAVTAELQGFRRFIQEGITLEVDANARASTPRSRSAR